MAPVALTFAVLELTDDSATALGQVLAANSIPMVVFLLVGGVVADRFSRSTVLYVSHLLSALTQGTVATLILTGTAELWMVIVLEALNGTVLAFTFPAMFGVVPQIVPRGYLQQANAMLSFSRSGLAIIGPTIAALLVVTVGAGWALAVDAATWLVAAGCMARVGIPARAKTEEEPAPSTLRDLREGWAAFTEHTWLWLIVVAFGVVNMIHAGAWFTLAPAVAKRTIGIDGWGYVLSAEAFGLLAMTLVFLRVRLRFPLRAGMLGTAVFALPVLIMGTEPQLLLLVVAAFLAGCGFETFGIGWNVAVQEHVDERVLSRVSSYDALGSFLAIPLGQLTFGPLGAAFGSGPVLVGAAAVYAVVALGTLLSPSVRNLQRVDAPGAVAVSAAAVD
jgi:MFS family permease